MNAKTVASSLLLVSLTAGTAAFAATAPVKTTKTAPAAASSVAPASGDTKPAAKAPAKAKSHRWHRHAATAKKTDTKKSGR
jgi:hypothetical protein